MNSKNLIISRLFIVLFGYASVFMFTACQKDGGNADAQQFLQTVKSGDEEQLRHLDVSAIGYEKLEAVSPGILYHLARRYRGLGLESVYLHCLEGAFTHAGPLYRALAAADLTVWFYDIGNYDSTSFYATAMTQYWYTRERGYALLLDCLYRQDLYRRYVTVHDSIAEVFPELEELHEEQYLEALLWLEPNSSAVLVSSWLENERWKESSKPLLDLAGKMSGSFDEKAINLILAKQARSSGSWKSAEEYYRDLVDAEVTALGDSETLNTTDMGLSEADSRYSIGIIYDLYDVYRLSGRSSEGGLYFQERAEIVLLPTARVLLSELSGRLYRTAGLYKNSQNMFMSALRGWIDIQQKNEAEVPGGNAQVADKIDTLLWLGFSNAIQSSLFSGTEIIELISVYGSKDLDVDSLLNEYCSTLIREQSWEQLWSSFELLEERLSPTRKAQFLGALSVAINAMLFSPAEEVRTEINDKFQNLFLEQGVDSYYYFVFQQSPNAEAEVSLSEVYLHNAFVGMYAGPENSSETTENGTGLNARKIGQQRDIVLQMLAKDALEYQNLALIKDLTMSNYRNLDSVTLFNFGRHFYEKSEFRWAIRAHIRATMLAPETGEEYLQFNLQELFPRPYVLEISEAAEKEGIHPWLLFALVRTESLFDAKAVSRVGAMGLSQLMPATAEEMAGRMRLYNPDYFDVGTNIAIGSRYLALMLDRVYKAPSALAAYNGGLTNVRRWAAAFGNLPDPLFVEAIPFPETRNYVKTLIESSVYYGSLYWGLSPEQIMKYFYNNEFLLAETVAGAVSDNT